jgi:hypothetical protein
MKNSERSKENVIVMRERVFIVAIGNENICV